MYYWKNANDWNNTACSYQFVWVVKNKPESGCWSKMPMTLEQLLQLKPNLTLESSNN